jgi:hypothetical protein
MGKRKRDSTQGLEEILLTIPDDVNYRNRWRRLAGGAHYGFFVLTGDANTRIALHHAQPDNVNTMPLNAGMLVVALAEEPYDGLWIRQDTGANPGRIWLFRNRMAMLSGIRALTQIQDEAGALIGDANPFAVHLREDGGALIDATNPLPVDIREIGGTAQFAGDYFLHWGARAGVAPATVAVGVASALAVAGRGGPPPRQGLYLRNTSAGPRRISLGLNGAPAVLDSGVTLLPNEWVAWDATTSNWSGVAPVYAICSLAGGSLAIQEAI